MRESDARNLVAHGSPNQQVHKVLLSGGVAQVQLPGRLTETDVKKLEVLFSTVTQLAEIDASSPDEEQEGR